MKIPMKNDIYMTPGIKKHLPNHSEEIHKALAKFNSGEFGSGSHRPSNELIKEFGIYELSFGTMWIISYSLFSERDFITLLLPNEYEGRD